MMNSAVEKTPGKPQFSLRWLLLVTAGAAVYLACALAVAQSGRHLLDAIMNGNMAGYSALVCLLLASVGFCLLVGNTIVGRDRTFWPIGLLLAALAYGAANVGVFIATLSVDRFAIFEPVYIGLVLFGAPAVMLITLVIVAGFIRRIGWLGAVGFFLWVHCIAFAHLWIIAAASASV